MKEPIAQRAFQIAEPILRGEGLELIDVAYVREGGRWILRLVIDKIGSGPGNYVGIDDCQRASQAVETAIEVADLVPHEYALEVSSPGIERPLTRPEHFQRFLGRPIKVKTYAPLFDPPRKHFAGVLVEFDAEEEVIEVEVEGAGRFRIPRKEIAKAHLSEENWE